MPNVSICESGSRTQAKRVPFQVVTSSPTSVMKVDEDCKASSWMRSGVAEPVECIRSWPELLRRSFALVTAKKVPLIYGALSMLNSNTWNGRMIIPNLIFRNNLRMCTSKAILALFNTYSLVVDYYNVPEYIAPRLGTSFLGGS